MSTDYPMAMEDVEGLYSYPVDVASFMTPKYSTSDVNGAYHYTNSLGHYPVKIAHYALSHWNLYLTTKDDSHRSIFLSQANWLVENEVRIGNRGGGWPIIFPHPDLYNEGPWLSALLQGNGISILMRAYQLTRKKIFLEVARRAICTFECDILDGGVSTKIGNNGIFFEEIAVYPATHRLTGFLFALLGLSDYVALIDDTKTKELIQRSLSTMHSLLEEFDVGYWTRVDLLHRHLASPTHLALQTTLLEAHAINSDCVQCSTLASRWKSYQRQLGSRLQYLITSQFTSFFGSQLCRVRSMLFPQAQNSPVLRVCVPITAYPVTGGMRTVIANIAAVTKDIWNLEYLTQHIGPHSDGLVIHQFGTKKTSPRYFPAVWFYAFTGFWKIILLLRRGAGYDLILLQDGIFTAAFAALAARLAGVRTVCIDHGNLGLLKSRIYRTERVLALAKMEWPYRILGRLQYIWYWPSLDLLARIAAHFVDHYFVPGVVGDGVEEICRELGVHLSHITRFANMIDIDRHILPDAIARAKKREIDGIPVDAIVVAIICRLEPEKGLEIAIKAINQALSGMSSNLCARVRVLIVGDGSLRRQIEQDICQLNLNKTCLLWGEATHDEVISLLGISDIFLYTSWRAAGYPLTILEAMASNCAIIASTEPLANEYMLAEGRGIIVPPGDAEQTARELIQLVSNPELRCRMGRLARKYLEMNHSASTFKRSLMQVTYSSAFDEVLKNGMKVKTISIKED